jgi:archaellum biogenesis ATPase FlaH
MIKKQYSDQLTRPPHGLAVYARKDAVLEYVNFSTPLLEFMILDIFYKGHIQVVFVYKAPVCKLEHFKEVFLSDVLSNLNILQSNILIIGDLNLSEQNMNENFVMFMENTFKCQQIVMKKTTDYATKLDLAFLKADIDFTQNV